METQIRSLVEIHQILQKKNQLLQFQYDELCLIEQEGIDEKTQLFLQNQLMIQQATIKQSRINQLSKAMPNLQAKYNKISQQVQEYKIKYQTAQRQHNLYLKKKKDSRNLINIQTSRKVNMAADCQQLVQKTQHTYNKIQNIKQQIRNIKQKQHLQKTTTDNLRNILSELTQIYQRQKKK